MSQENITKPWGVRLSLLRGSAVEFSLIWCLSSGSSYLMHKLVKANESEQALEGH